MLSANGASTNAVTNSIALNAAQYILQNLTNADPHIKGALWSNASVLSISAGP